MQQSLIRSLTVRIVIMNLLFLSVLITLSSAFVIASPSNHATRQNKERVEDAFQHHTHNEVNGEEDDHELDHEAILGSKQKTKEYDGLSPEESQVRLRHLVENGIDANRDGFVDREELTQWVIKSFFSLATEEGHDRLEEDDDDHDGFVTWKEYLKGSYDYEDKDKNELMAEDEALWKAADKDHDGRLDAEEYAAFNSPEEFDHMHETLVSQVFKRRDQNLDGKIDFNEFIADDRGEKPLPTSEHYLVEKDKFENVYDVNKDHVLDFQEAYAWIVPSNTEIAESEADHLISTADANRDGKLTHDEIVHNYDVFVGSEATGFGEQLHDEL